jgi:hypothetical protein
MRGRLLFAVGVALLAACASSQAPGRLTPDGFQSLHASYGVHYANGRVGTFVSDDWQLESFARIRRIRGHERRIPRRGPEWSGPIRIDVDGDGFLDDIGNGHLYDLRLRRETDGALLWVRRVPLPAHLADASLAELGRLYARDLSRGRDAFLGESLLAEEGEPERVPVRLIDEAELGVSGHAARGIVVQASRPPPLGVAREAYVLVRTPFTLSEHSALGERRFAMLLVVGYAGRPGASSGELEDLSALLSAIEITPRSGS